MAWSPGALWARATLAAKPQPEGCAVELKVRFGSGHGNVVLVGIWPWDDTAYNWPSNGKLELDFLKELSASFAQRPD